MHLSNLQGVPMHAFKNGLYWAQQDKQNTLANHLRINVEEAKSLCEQAKTQTKYKFSEFFANFVEQQKERWQKEATDFIELIQNYQTA